MTALQPTIQIDTREQRPLPITAYPVESVALPVGDYGIRGFSNWTCPQFIVERKSLDDLVQSLTFDRPRFDREIMKLRQFAFHSLLIEGNQGEVEFEQYRSTVSPNAILQSLAAYQVRCNLHVIWAGDSQGAARALERLVRQLVRGI